MITRERALELFNYDPETGILRLRTDRHMGKKGDVVGAPDGKGYLHVYADGKHILVHRIVFLMSHGWLPKQIDHKNRDILDNRLDNLRAATQSKNNMNRRAASGSGFKGVCFHKRDRRWQAQININGKQTYLGGRDTAEEAALLYDEAAKKHFGEFALLNFGTAQS